MSGRARKSIADVLRDAEALERFFDEHHGPEVTVETKGGGERRVLPRMALFGCVLCDRLESGSPERGPLHGPCGVHGDCMKRLYRADEVAAVLRDHYLAAVNCDHEAKRDNAVCQCSRVDLGWHPSVGQAVESWVQHVLAMLGAPSSVVSRPDERNPE